MQTEVVRSGEDTLEFVKRPGSPAETRRLEREAQLLARLRHPGVVELAAGESGANEGEDDSLRLRAVDGRTLAGLTLSAEEVAGVGAAAATILADLHDLGLAHGACDGTHILIDPAGRPVLCSFGRARGTGWGDDVRPVQREDVRGLADALRSTLADDGRPLRRRLERCRSSHPPSARALARQLAETVPACHLPRLDEAAGKGHAGPVTSLSEDEPGSAGPARENTARQPVVRPPRPSRPKRSGARRHRPPPRLATAAGGAALISVLLLAVLRLDRGGAGTTPSACPAVDAGCRPLATQGGVVTTSTGHWSVGAPGDLLVVGRWWCGATSLPAVLRPSTGQVWLFRRWATVGNAVVGTPLATIPGAHTLQVLPGTKGCDGLATIAGSRTVILLSARRAP